MASKKIQINLSEIANEAIEYVDVCPALNPSESDQPQIVERIGTRLAIVDGYHRTAGQIRWCRENGVDIIECLITVIECDDEDLIADAAEPSERQQDAIDAIYAAIR